jgi:hypothetical protein
MPWPIENTRLAVRDASEWWVAAVFFDRIEDRVTTEKVTRTESLLYGNWRSPARAYQESEHQSYDRYVAAKA